MKYDLLKPCCFSLLILFATCQSIFGDSPVQSGTQLFLNRFSDDAENDNAVCNDGTKGGYYFSPASLAEANDTFVIHLPGGGQCYDEESCNERWKFKPTSMSSVNFPASKYKKGFMDNSMKKTPFWSANKVMLGYCSSDGYMGDVAASIDTWGWHFRGQQLVFAMIRDLIANRKLSSTSTIVFSGGSAGARGVMVLIDLLVADYFPKGSKVLGFLDSPYYIDVASFSPLYKGFQYEESMKYKHMNTKNIISPECAATYPDVNEQWKCQFGQYRMPFVKTSYFLISSQYDSYQLQMDTQTVPPYGKSATDYVNRFGSTIHNSLVFLRDMKLRESAIKTSFTATYAFYSWTCYNHDVSASSEFYTMAVDEGVTQKDALESFLKASLVIYSSTKGVVGSDYVSSGVSVSSAGQKGGKVKKDKAMVEGKHVEGTDKISLSGMRDESSGMPAKKVMERLTTVHSWVDSCSGMNCGTSCSAGPASKPAISASRERSPSAEAQGQFDIPSMGGKSPSTGSKSKGQMLAQYNAESDSEEEDTDNADEKPLFKPIAAHNHVSSPAATSSTPITAANIETIKSFPAAHGIEDAKIARERVFPSGIPLPNALAEAFPSEAIRGIAAEVPSFLPFPAPEPYAVSLYSPLILTPTSRSSA